MKTYSGSNAGSHIEGLLWNARKSVWIISPWIGMNYAKRVALMSQKGIEVRIVTSNVDYNRESLKIFKALENPNLMLLVLDEEAVFVHSKIYVVDKEHAIFGSANFTYSGLNRNIESLTIAENRDEVQKIEADFMRIWLDSERKRIPTEGLASETAYSIKNALPLDSTTGYEGTSHPDAHNILVYHPYYFFEFSFRVPVGKSPPMLFENGGLVVIDGVTRQITEDNLLVEEIDTRASEDYFLKTENRYQLVLHEPKIHDFREARELALEHIRDKNTHHYTQRYGNRLYDRIFVPYRSAISFIKSGFVQVPIWYIERLDQKGGKHQDVVLGSSGRKWNELIYCSECQKKVWISQATTCKTCGKQVCPDCISDVGLIFKKKLCAPCLSKSR